MIDRAVTTSAVVDVDGVNVGLVVTAAVVGKSEFSIHAKLVFSCV